MSLTPAGHVNTTALPTPARIGDNERLSATLVLSLLVHGMLLLGLGFALDDAAPVMPTLDVILSTTRTPLTPKQADFLAQASQQGGGEHRSARRPRETQAGHVPRPEAGLAPRELKAQAPAPQAQAETRVITTLRGDTVTPAPRATPTPSQQPLPPGPDKVERDLSMARLAAEIHLRSERYAKRPKRKFVSASTREYAYAAYLRAWVDRVERIGNLNYPDEARRRHIGGLLVISVAIRRDGRVERTDVIQSSRVPMLDAAALRIIELSEPFPALPDAGDDVDVLHVTRTWQFMPGGELVDR